MSNRITALIPYYSGKVLEQFGFQSEDFQRTLAVLQSHIDSVSDRIIVLGGNVENTFALIKSEVQKHEYIQQFNTYATCAVVTLSNITVDLYNYALDTTDLHSFWGSNAKKRWIFGIAVSVSY